MARKPDPLLHRARIDARKRLQHKALRSSSYSAEELTLLGRLLDEHDRKVRAWRRRAAESPVVVSAGVPAVVPTPLDAAGARVSVSATEEAQNG